MAAKKKKLTPMQQRLIDFAGHTDEKGKELSFQQSAYKSGYSLATASVGLQSSKMAWLKEMWHAQAEKIRAARRKGIEKAAEKRQFDVMVRLAEIAEVPHRETNNTLTTQHEACKTYATIEGRYIVKSQISDLRGKTEDELEYAREHGNYPTTEQLQEFVNRRRGSPGTEEAQRSGDAGEAVSG